MLKFWRKKGLICFGVSRFILESPKNIQLKYYTKSYVVKSGKSMRREVSFVAQKDL